MSDETAPTKGAWWHGPLIGGIMTMTAGISNYVGSHWGGATLEQMKAGNAEMEERLTKRIDSATAKVSDDMRKYVTEGIAASEKRTHDELVTAKKKKRSNAEP